MMSIEVDIPSIAAIRGEIEFEVVKALTRTARDAADAVKADMPTKFTLRRDWITKGIRFEAATKADPVARVYSMDELMEKQEFGEVHSPKGKHVAIPAQVRSRPNMLIPLSRMPRKILDQKNAFIGSFEGKGGHKFNGLEGIFQRDRKRKSLRLLYLLKERKTTRPRWDFEKTVTETVDHRFQNNLLIP
jgi:hypothetical protein